MLPGIILGLGSLLLAVMALRGMRSRRDPPPRQPEPQGDGRSKGREPASDATRKRPPPR